LIAGLIVQSGCAATPEKERLAMSENTLPERPAAGMNSPGEGTPSGPVARALPVSDVPGDWVFMVGGETYAITLEGEPGEASGKVSAPSGWPEGIGTVSGWIYLAFGQLMLVSEAGGMIWSGSVEDHDHIVELGVSAGYSRKLVRAR
jgi:hypothetical protein